jgi:NADP-reducing hydrogenase subunit HndB
MAPINGRGIMSKLKIEDLEKIREKVRQRVNLLDGKHNAKITVHMGTCGIASGAGRVLEALSQEIKERGIPGLIVTTSGCAGLCSREPMATVELKGKAPVKYIDLNEDKIRKILNEHVLGEKIVSEYALALGCEMT